MKYGLCLLLAIGVAVPGGTASLRAQGVTYDLWDVNVGTIVTAHTGIISQSSPLNMFGGVLPSGNSDTRVNTHFRDDRAAGAVHAIEWQTADPVTLDRYVLYAFHDDDTTDYDRAFSSVKLFVFDEGLGEFQLVDAFTPSIPYFVAVFERSVATVTGQRFRAEFVQYACCHFPGPRVSELDAFYAPPRTGALITVK